MNIQRYITICSRKGLSGNVQAGKSDHITSPGVTTAKTESQVGPVQRRREHRDVIQN